MGCRLWRCKFFTIAQKQCARYDIVKIGRAARMLHSQ